MTRVSIVRTVCAISFTFLGSVGAKAADASVNLKTDSAEICTSVGGRQQVVRSFGGDTFFVIASRDPSARPLVKDKYSYKKEAGGTSEMNEVSFDMFELIAETFGGVKQPKDQWKAAFEELFDGRITVSDETGKSVGTFTMTCHAATIEFK